MRDLPSQLARFSRLLHARMAVWPHVMSNRFKPFAREIGKRALSSVGTTVAPAALNLGTQYAEFDPDVYVAEPISLQVHHMLGETSSQTADEQEFMMAMLKTWEEGRAEARTEGEANALLTVLRARGIAVPDTARERILAQKAQGQLERWLEKSVVASSIAEVLDDPT